MLPRRVAFTVLTLVLSSLACSASDRSAVRGHAGSAFSGSEGGGSGGTAGDANAGGGGASGGAAGGDGSGGSGGSGGSSGSSGAGAGGGAPTPAENLFVYTGGYKQTISLLTLDVAKGDLTVVGSVRGVNGPSYLAVSSNKKYLYAIDQLATPNLVVAFAIDQQTGALTEINRATTTVDGVASGATHLALDPTGKWVGVAHYDSGHVSILPLQSDGSVGPATAVALPGKNAHQVVWDPSGKYLSVPCLGSNFVAQFKFADGLLTPNEPPSAPVAGGPRHMVFAPDGRVAWVLGELESIITSLDYDAQTGMLSAPVSQPTADPATGTWSAHVALHPSGKFLYASNRTPQNSIAIFSVAGKNLKLEGFEKTLISVPTDFAIDPSGRFLVVGNVEGPVAAVLFAIDPLTGFLTLMSSVPVMDLLLPLPDPIPVPFPGRLPNPTALSNASFVGFLHLP